MTGWERCGISRLGFLKRRFCHTVLFVTLGGLVCSRPCVVEIASLEPGRRAECCCGWIQMDVEGRTDPRVWGYLEGRMDEYQVGH